MRTITKALAALVIGAGLGSLSQGGFAQAPAPDPWKLSQTADSCYLQRSFGTGERKVDLLIQSFGSTTPYHVIVRGSGLPLRRQRAESARVGFGGEKAAEDTLVLIGKSADVPMMVITASLPRPSQLNHLGWLYTYRATKARRLVPIDPSAQDLFVDFPEMATLDLPLGPMIAQYDKLDACAAAIERKWAVAVATDGVAMDAPTMTTQTAGQWQFKYPPSLLLNRISGLVELRMTVDAKGRAHDCVVQIAIWSPLFGEHACSDIQEYARFEPAHDAQGKPVSGLYRTAMTFMIYDW